VLLVSASVVGGELEFATTFDNALLRINAVLVALTALGFIWATKGKLGYIQPEESETISEFERPAEDPA